MKRGRWISVLALLASPLANAADVEVDFPAKVAALEQQVERVESLRAVKHLTAVYSQYAQAGLWREMVSLFASSGELVYGEERASGADAIYQLIRRIHGGGTDRLPEGGFNVRLISTPVVVLSDDGVTATGRYHDFGINGRVGLEATWSGGLQENRYVREDGVWKFAELHYHAVFGGSYEEGWRSLAPVSPVIPYSFTPKQAGEPLGAEPVYPAAARLTASQADARLGAIERRVAAMVEGDRVLNLQGAYGYYLDRKMWDDVADLFTADAVIEDAEVGIFEGATGVRRWLATMGEAGLARGEANDRPQFGTVVRVEPNGLEARTRGLQMSQLGRVDTGEASLGFQVLEGRFVKQGGVWRIREMRTFPILNTDYYQGFHRHNTVKAVGAVADFFFVNPVTRRNVRYPAGVRVVGRGSLTPPFRAPAVARKGTRETRLAEAERGLEIALAYHGAENVTNAFSYWLDDFAWDKASALFHAEGWRGKYMVGFYAGPENILKAETAMYGTTSPTRNGAALHYRPQPVIDVNEDGTRVKVRARLINIGHRWGGEPGSFMTGMYPNDGAVLDGGTWKLWTIAIDEPYIVSDGWKRGWARPRPPQPVDPAAPPLGTSGIFKRMTDVIKPDMPIANLRLRERGFVPGDLVQWPDIKPMWFHYRNPVSGREPPNYCPDLHTCEAELQAKETQQ